MASSLPASSLEDRQEHEGDVDREATEMGEYDEVLRRSSVYMNSSAQMSRPSNATSKAAHFLSKWRSLAKWWQRQVSATVQHDACRDHFGKPVFSSAGPTARWSRSFDIYFT